MKFQTQGNTLYILLTFAPRNERDFVTCLTFTGYLAVPALGMTNSAASTISVAVTGCYINFSTCFMSQLGPLFYTFPNTAAGRGVRHYLNPISRCYDLGRVLNFFNFFCPPTIFNFLFVLGYIFSLKLGFVSALGPYK